MWLTIFYLVLGVLGAWDNLMKIPGVLARTVRRARQVFTFGVPLSIQVCEAVDTLGFTLVRSWQADPFTHPRLFTVSNVPLTTWLLHPSWAAGSYRRHLGALRKSQARLLDMHAA